MMRTAPQAARLRVTYVVGSSHTGSTLLALLADQHPDVASVGETAPKPRIRREGRSGRQHCSCGAPLAGCPFWQQVFQSVTQKGVALNADEWSNDYRFENYWLDTLLTRETSSVAVRRVRWWASRRLPILRQRVSRIDRVNVAFVAAVLAQKRASVLLDTTKLLTRLTYLLEIPDLEVTVVRLVRDVRGFAASAKRDGRAIEDAARVWVKDQEAILRVTSALPPQRMLLMRYEDLCREPAATMRKLWELCRVEPIALGPALDGQEHHVLGNNMRMRGPIRVELDETWRTRLTEGEQGRVLRIAGPMTEQLGYV
jgi:hypothetical protein